MEKDSPILLVDDSAAMRQMIKSTLVGLGYQNIHAASNGAEALAKIKAAQGANFPYQLIFLDWNMPQMDGFTLLKACRGELGMKDTAIIMLTAVSDQNSIVQALKSGVNAYITKPVSTETIRAKMTQVTAWLDNQKQQA